MESWTAEYWLKNTGDCLDKLQNDDNWYKIPLINSIPSVYLKEGRLARFCGMVQDMYNPVYYLSFYEVHNTLTKKKIVRCGKYKDSLECSEHEEVLFDSEKSVNQERHPVYCISVPAINEWAQIKTSGSNTNVNNDIKQHSHSGVKRCADNDQPTLDSGVNCIGHHSSKKMFAESSVGSHREIMNEGKNINLNLPIADSEAVACIINFYDTEDGELKMNDVIEVVGFLSYDLASLTSEADSLAEELPPPSLVPRLHAVTLRPIHSCNPLLTSQVSLDGVMQNASQLRDELKLILTQLLFGDALAADYLICHLMSKIYLRQDITVLGKFSLNLSNVPSSVSNYPAKLYQFLQSLLVKSHFLPMTIENMNSIYMVPKKNYKTNRLESGMLQLSDKTHLIVDETQLQPGQLNDRGVRNCRALASVITNQRLQYDFEFYPVEFHTDLPFLILSDGKSMLPNDYHVPLAVDPMCTSTIEEVFTAAYHYLREPLLSQLRIYLSVISSINYDLTTDVQQSIQEDFVKMRQEHPNTSAQDLHSLLVLAKYLSLSQGSTCLPKNCWQMAQKMENERKSRL